VSTEPRSGRASPQLRWAALVALSLVGVLVVSLWLSYQLTDQRLGFIPEATEAGFEVFAVSESTPAEQGDLEAGDVILSVDGQPVRDEEDYDQIASRFRRGVPVRVDVARGEDRVSLVLIPGVPFEWTDSIIGVLAFLAYLVLGLVASGRMADDLRARLLSAFCFAVALELALLDLPYVTGHMLAAVTYLLVTGLQIGLDFHLATVLPTTPAWLEERRWVPRAYYAVGIGFGLFAAASMLGAAAGLPGFELPDRIANDLLDYWLLPVWAVGVTSIYTTRTFRHPDPRGRHQAGLVLLGILPWVAVVLHDTVGPLLDPATQLVSSSVWNFALLAYPVAVFVAIYLYQLFDLELVVRKSFLYGSITTLLVLGFYGIVGGIGTLFARQLGDEGVPLWVISTAGLSMGLLFNPLRTRLKKVIDRRLFPERQALRSRLVRLAAELPAQGKLPRMGEHLSRELKQIFAVDSVGVWIAAPPQGQLVEMASTRDTEDDPERTALIGAEDPALQLLARSGRPTPAATLAPLSRALHDRLGDAAAEIVVPLLVQGSLIGLIALGRKREAQRWVAEELELLNLLGHHAAIVFENARLFDSATYEGLTGLYRREALLEILDREWSRAQRYERPLAVALVDLDHFKEVNDRFGHLTGDLVLQRVAAELRAQIRETDFAGRFGGEEFVAVLPETSVEGATQLAEKMRSRIERMEVPSESGRPVRVTISVGVAGRELVRDDDRTRGRGLIAAADQALYGAKNRGRNRVEAAAR